MTDSAKPTGRFHPACLLLPEMTAGEFAELVADIKAHGQRQPIRYAADTGLILDGRHRWRACEQLGQEAWLEEFKGDEAEQLALIMSENVHRRHLTTQQRAAVAAELAEKLADAAKQRQLAALKQNQPLASTEAHGDRPPPSASTEAHGKAAEQAAKMVGGVSRASVERARARMRTDPAAHEAAKAGKLTRKPPKPKPTDGDREPPKPKVPKLDVITAMRQLADALSATKMTPDVWAAEQPDFRCRVLLSDIGTLSAALSRLTEALRQRLKAPEPTPELPSTPQEREEPAEAPEASPPPVAAPEPPETQQGGNGAASDGEAIRAWRMAAGLTQKEAADRLGTSNSRLCLIEQGKSAPSANVRQKFREQLGAQP